MKKSPLDDRVDSVESPDEGDLDVSNVDDEMEPSSAVIIDIFDGQVPDDTDASKRLCRLEGGVVGPRLETLQEVSKLLEISIEKYAVPTLSDESITAFVSVRSMDKVVPFARIDGWVDNGYLDATMHFADGSAQTIRRAAVASEADVMMLIYRIVLLAQRE